MYQALYRKWRPRTFADVVGQAHITDTLRRQAAAGRPSHAYLFTGTRGTGKTTCAKILAKAVNCLHSVDGDPCGRCPACMGVDNGSLLDVLELDAASNNGVDHVRALRDEAIYSPASVRYRVYIVDEVHMLSTAAFNALLKILEEPPEHLIFILATTELHKVPATILSRCQRFAFKRIQPGDIAARLAYVAEQEGMELTGDAAALLARLADGALRDALSLLDQCAAGGGAVDSERVLDVLGLAGRVQTAELMGLLLARDVRGSLLLLDRLYRGGKDMGALLGELSALARDLLIRMTVGEGGDALLSGGYDGGVMDGLIRGASAARLLHMTALLQETSAALPLSANRRTDAELCLMRLCDESLCGDVTALAARIARLEEGGVAAPAGNDGPRGVTAASIPKQPAPPPQKSAPPPVDDAPPWDDNDAPPPPTKNPDLSSQSTVVDVAGGNDGPAAPPADLWAELLDRCKGGLSGRYRGFLDDARGVLEGDRMVVHCADEFVLENLDAPEVRKVIQDETSKKLGRPMTVRFVVGGMDAAPPADKLDELIRAGSKYPEFTVK